jgi:hypothetical protein
MDARYIRGLKKPVTYYCSPLIFDVETGTGVGRDVLHPILPDEHFVRSHWVPRLVVEGTGSHGDSRNDLAQREKRPGGQCFVCTHF